MVDSSPEQSRRRWHDDRGDLSEVMDLLESIPPEVRSHIALALTAKADQQFQASALLKSLKTLGREKIMALHQARSKRRAYDQDRDLSEIATTLLILPPDAQDGLAKDLLTFTELVVEYMANCDTFELVPNEQELVTMRDRFVTADADAVQRYLEEIHQPVYERLAAADEPPVVEPLENRLVQAKEGLRIKDVPVD